MCNLSQGVYERGVEQGKQRGVEQGWEQGKREDIMNMDREGFAADMISRLTGVSVEKVKSILAGS